jgi:hypothetical protein
VDDQLFGDISAAVEAASRLEGPPGSMAWPQAVLCKLQTFPPVDRLLVSECLWSEPQVMLAGSVHLADMHDRQLLGLTEPVVTMIEATHKLQQIKVFRWLRQNLEREGGPQFFGALSSALQDSLLDNPAPHRREVKSLLALLLAWCDAFPLAGVLVDKPQHSQRVRLSSDLGQMPNEPRAVSARAVEGGVGPLDSHTLPNWRRCRW